MGVVVHGPTGIRLHLIPGGPARLGQRDPLPHEAPPFTVQVAPVWIARAPVSQAEWDRLGGVDRRRVTDPERPIHGVSWLAARAWCARAGLRLPREVEWEHAARAGSETPFPWGDEFDPARAWTLENAERTPQPAAQHAEVANDFGLIDTQGNVAEWCEGDLDQPMEGSAWHEWDPGKVLRGGSVERPSIYARCAYRAGADPRADYPDHGLRPALDVAL